MNLKEELAKLPSELRTVANKFEINRPDSSIPEFVTNRVMGTDKEEFSLEMNENEYFDIAEWAFEKQGKTLPDEIPGVKDYFGKISIFSAIILMKIFSPRYESGELKPCNLYTNNENVVPVGIKDRKKLNKLCAEKEKTAEKGAIYAEHYGISKQFEELSDWEQGLFYQYCYENKAANTRVGKN